MSLIIRPMRDEDIDQLAQFLSEIHGTVISPEAIRHERANIPPQIKHADWVAEVGGVLAGGAQYQQYLGAYHPRKFDVGVIVRPAYRRRGIGSALYETMMEALQEHDPIGLGAGVRENEPDGIRFAEKRGFKEVMRTWESHLDLTALEPPSYAGVLEAVLAQGYTIRSFTELVTDLERQHQLHALMMELRRDIPSPEPRTDLPFEEWAKRLSHPHFDPDGYLIAIKGDEWVGSSSLARTDEEGVLHTGITAVKREHRGTGLAKALKLVAIRHARERGFRKIKTWNESNNQPMLRINDALGFVRQPAWVSYKRVLGEE